MIECLALTVGLHIGTYHADRTKDYQEINPGAYVRCDNYVVGGYYNSKRRGSLYAARVFELGPVDLAVGGVTGYPGHTIAPLVVPSVRVGDARVHLILPSGRDTGAIHLSWEF